VNDLNLIASEIESRFIPHPCLTVDSLQRWLEAKTLQTDPREIPRFSTPKNDPWGNPFQVGDRLDENGERQFVVYSFGRDGLSNTNGNDPDDINSWSDDPVAHYQREARRESQVDRMSFAVPLMFILYIPMLLLLRTRRKTEPLRLSHREVRADVQGLCSRSPADVSGKP
jgi:hypothetical protein